jgi:phosphopantothenoylcysteine decarboxylase/phosphopantothenate--cysteine ligase
MSQPEVLIGITGGIAAYKTAEVISRLVQDSVAVTAVMTPAAEEFIGTATLAALTGRPVACAAFDQVGHPLGPHITLAQRADVVCVAPATADFIAKLAHGHADDLLSTTILCFDGPLLIAPAMNSSMWSKRAVQRNIRQLQEDGCQIVGPEEGWLSCRTRGPGRMAEPETIIAAIRATLPV